MLSRDPPTCGTSAPNLQLLLKVQTAEPPALKGAGAESHGGTWWGVRGREMAPRDNVVGRRARVQRRSRSWDRQRGVDPSHLSQTLIRRGRAKSGLSLTLNFSRDLNPMPWEAVRALGGAFWIPRVRIPARPPESDSLCPHQTRASAAGSVPGGSPWSLRAAASGVEVMLSSSRPSRGGDRPRTSVPSVRPSGRPLEERDGFLVSGLKSSAEVKMRREEGKQQEERGKKVLSCEKGAEFTNIY